MPYNVLFPFKDGAGITDFSKENGNGWIEANADDNILKSMSKYMKGSGANLGDKESAVMSIPSPIAYVLDFVKRLKDDDDRNARNEWRGLLAAIALQKLKGIEINVTEYDIGDEKTFRGLIGEELRSNGSISGYTDQSENQDVQIIDDKKLYVFSRGSTPFAIYLPSIIICPFKEYDRTIFNDLSWCSQDGEWQDVITCSDIGCGDGHKSFGALNSTAQKLYFWLSALEGELNGGKYVRLISDFKERIYKPSEHNNYNPDCPENILQDWDNITDLSVYSALKKICVAPQWAPQNVFSENLLLLIAPKGANFKNDNRGVSFVPQRMPEFCKDEKDGAYGVYVIPPISTQVIDSLKKGAAISVDRNGGWSVEYDAESKKIHFKVALSYREGTFSEKKEYETFYDAEHVYWISDLPYISMWPNVRFKDSSWKNYLVSIFMRRTTGESWCDWQAGNMINGWIGKYDFSNNQLVGEAVSHGSQGEQEKSVIDIKIISDGTEKPNPCVCRSNCTLGIEDKNITKQEFNMIQSESVPYALSFSCNKGSLGCWTIQWSDAIESEGSTAIIGMDFGTTSTNVYMKLGNDSPRSISSPDRYVYDIYNPCPGKNESSLFQRYYLFGSKNEANNDGRLGKIFTYGQNFITGANDQIKPNITGRFVKVDKEYILADNKGKTGIYNGLKWSSSEDRNRPNARRNFVNTLLTFATLEAKAEGASDIHIRLSYPSRIFGNAISDSIEQELLKRYMGDGAANTLTFKGATEAMCAGKYHEVSGYGTDNAVTAQTGYAVVDIGGGTTDVSFVKNSEDGQTAVQSEHSFKIAGIDIIEKTFIDYFERRAPQFNEMWTEPTESNDTNTIATQKFNDIKRPEGNPEEYYAKKGEILNFLMENSEIKEGCYKNPQYQELFQAIRIKYYVLFWLIASFFGQDKKVQFNPANIAVCLAGCGSKGYDLCEGSLGKQELESNICQVFVTALGEKTMDEIRRYIAQGYEPRFLLRKSQNGKSKEEVAYGLCSLDENDVSSIGNIQIDNRRNNPTDGGVNNFAFLQNPAPKTSEDVTTGEDVTKENFKKPTHEELGGELEELIRAVKNIEEATIIENISKKYRKKFFAKTATIEELIGKSETNTLLYKKLYAALMLYAMIDEELRNNNSPM